jgi:hypothetical protein
MPDQSAMVTSGIMTTSYFFIGDALATKFSWELPWSKKRLQQLHGGMTLFPVVCSRIRVPSLGSISFFHIHTVHTYAESPINQKKTVFSNVSVEIIVLLNYKPLETVARCRGCNDPGVLNSHIFIYVP